MTPLPRLGGRNVAGEPGEPWFLIRHQTGVIIDAWSDGLRVVLNQPANEKNPRGSTMPTLTTRGLGDAAFTDPVIRRRGWWDQRFETVGPGRD